MSLWEQVESFPIYSRLSVLEDRALQFMVVLKPALQPISWVRGPTAKHNRLPTNRLLRMALVLQDRTPHHKSRQVGVVKPPHMEAERISVVILLATDFLIH